MTQTYRTNDGARWGTGQGFNLTAAQVDINFWDVIQRIITLEALPGAAAGIASFSITGTDFYVHMTDATVLGPYTLPIATYTARGPWAPATAYAVMDTVTNGGSLYEVIFAHTSAGSFSAGANDGMGHDYYSVMLQTPGNVLPTGGSADMLLAKTSGTDFAVGWVASGMPRGGTVGEYLAKNSSSDFDAQWVTAPRVFTSASASTRSLIIGDQNKYLRCSSATDLTIPLHSDVAFPIDSEICIRQVGTGDVNILLNDTTIILNVPAGYIAKLQGQGATATLKNVGSDEWDLMGMLAS